MPEVAVVGDIHGHFTEADVAAFNRSSYDLVLLVGDLEPLRATLSPDRRSPVAGLLSRLTRPALLIPGNHDAVWLPQLVAEVSGARALAELTGLGHQARLSRLEAGLSPVQVGGYSLHSFDLGGEGGRFDVIAGRPCSMGGPTLSFRPLLRRRNGLGSLEASARRLMDLVERSEAEAVIFLAHNGPTGLGGGRADLWGRDFGRREGDWGDRDLRLAVDHAQGLGKRVIAVVAGHMHRAVRGGGERPGHLSRGGVLSINAAQVPRIASGKRHHLRLAWGGSGPPSCEDLWVS